MDLYSLLSHLWAANNKFAIAQFSSIFTAVVDKFCIMCDSNLGGFVVKMYSEQAGEKALKCKSDLVAPQSRSLHRHNFAPCRIVDLVFIQNTASLKDAKHS